MVNGKTPVYLTLIAGAMFAAAMLISPPYVARLGPPSPWEAYAQPAQRYLSAALKRDSMALVEQSASPAPVAWGLEVARRYPDSLAAWVPDPQVWAGFNRGDTAEVLLHTESDVCSEQPIWMRFIGKADSAKVVEAGSACFEQRSALNELVIPDVAKGRVDSP
jgi:hypothetical protein